MKIEKFGFLRGEIYCFKINRYSFARWRTCYGVTVCIRQWWIDQCTTPISFKICSRFVCMDGAPSCLHLNIKHNNTNSTMKFKQVIAMRANWWLTLHSPVLTKCISTESSSWKVITDDIPHFQHQPKTIGWTWSSSCSQMNMNWSVNCGK